LKPEITQKVESVPSLKTHLKANSTPVQIASPGKSEGLSKQTSLFGNHRSRASAAIAGLAFSVGLYGSFNATHRPSAIAAESIPTESMDLSTPANSSSIDRQTGDKSYVEQIRNSVSAMRSEHGQASQSTSTLLAQSFANRGDMGPRTSENSVSIPVPAPKVQVFRRSAPSVATSSPNFSQPGYTRGGGEHDLPDDGSTIDGTTSLQFAWPAQGKLTSRFGRRWGRMHRGIDIAGPVGTPIYAAADGVVVDAGWHSGGYGNLVEVRHNDGTVTRYAHNSRLRVTNGQMVRQGQQIADMGSTGRSTGSHLHFEIRPQGGSAANPINFLIASR
jgi:murein DD-endopeptidase MepM/ murein hydrolase activator NlpD